VSHVARSSSEWRPNVNDDETGDVEARAVVHVNFTSMVAVAAALTPATRTRAK